MQLVEIKKLDLVTNSAVIASGVMKDHKPVIQLIRKYKSDLEEFGRVEFEMRPFQTDGGMQKQEIALLNEQQTTLLITYMRNNEVVREFKKRLVYEFFTMRSALAKNSLVSYVDTEPAKKCRSSLMRPMRQQKWLTSI